GGARGRRRGAALRHALHGAEARRGARLQERHQPAITRGGARGEGGAGARRGRPRGPRAVRARRLLRGGLEGPRARAAGVQPERGPPRHLGEDREGRLLGRRPAGGAGDQWKKTPASMLSTWPVTLSERQNVTT